MPEHRVNKNTDSQSFKPPAWEEPIYGGWHRPHQSDLVLRGYADKCNLAFLYTIRHIKAIPHPRTIATKLKDEIRCPDTY